jgi:hypothetical protein
MLGATILVVAAAAAIGGVRVAHRPTTSWTGNGTGGIAGAIAPNSLPFPDAVPEQNFATAEAVLGWHIVRPHGCFADDNKVTTIYVSPTGDQADIIYQDLSGQSHCQGEYRSGHLEVMEHPSPQVLSDHPPTTPTLTQMMQDAAANLGGSTWVQTVAGVPAIVIQGNYPGDCDASPAPGQQGCLSAGTNNPPSLQFQFGRVDIGIIGDPSWSTTSMIAIGDTVN